MQPSACAFSVTLLFSIVSATADAPCCSIAQNSNADKNANGNALRCVISPTDRRSERHSPCHCRSKGGDWMCIAYIENKKSREITVAHRLAIFSVVCFSLSLIININTDDKIICLLYKINISTQFSIFVKLLFISSSTFFYRFSILRICSALIDSLFSDFQNSILIFRSLISLHSTIFLWIATVIRKLFFNLH